jgi:hypothetical protein
MRFLFIRAANSGCPLYLLLRFPAQKDAASIRAATDV